MFMEAEFLTSLQGQKKKNESKEVVGKKNIQSEAKGLTLGRKAEAEGWGGGC